jgi:hypothetical protein
MEQVMRFKYRLCVLALAMTAAIASPIAAEGLKSSAEAGFVASTKLEAKASLSGTLAFPFLAGPGALVSGNQVELKLGAELSPVSLGASLEATWTPIAFLQVVGGAAIGSGWNIPIANGLRLNVPVGAGGAELRGGAFAGAVWSAKAGAALQFDLAALVPGEWNHVVVRSYHQGRYRALSSAGSGDSWLWENDEGENRNGWSYYGNYLLGYMPPGRLTMVGLLAEEEIYLYGTPGGSAWGEELGRWTFGPLASYAATDRLSVSLLVQLRTMRNFTDATKDLGFYADRRLVSSGALRRLEFYRAALLLGYKLE